mmetsp:Transcript_10056/g.30063  ORF Transcript_10056/g.30063 Transcript_10056/m.30063 type:complete len:205 (+) Transcript_10056:854-1468(+)
MALGSSASTISTVRSYSSLSEPLASLLMSLQLSGVMPLPTRKARNVRGSSCQSWGAVSMWSKGRSIFTTQVSVRRLLRRPTSCFMPPSSITALSAAFSASSLCMPLSRKSWRFFSRLCHLAMASMVRVKEPLERRFKTVKPAAFILVSLMTLMPSYESIHQAGKASQVTATIARSFKYPCGSPFLSPPFMQYSTASMGICMKLR